MVRISFVIFLSLLFNNLIGQCNSSADASACNYGSLCSIVLEPYGENTLNNVSEINSFGCEIKFQINSI